MAVKPFVHLHMHYEGSLADSALRSKDAAKKAAQLEMPALAITDHGFMYKVVDFYKDCKAEGVKPIIGMETYVAPRRNTMKEHGIDDANYHLVLLCENNDGYHNLIKIASDAALDGFYYKPRTDNAHLKKLHDGLIALSACVGGEVQQKLLNNDYNGARSTALLYDEIFGRGNFYLELQDHGMPEQKIINQGLLKLHAETGIPLVATNDCHYLNASSYEAHDVLMAIQAKTLVTDKVHRKVYGSDQFYFKTQDEMWELFGHIPEALENTVKIADRCNVEFEFGKNKMPEYDVPDGYTKESYLRELVEKGARERYGKITKEIRDRLDYELGVIVRTGWPDYFLIMWDLFNFIRSADILPGPGRGSGAGSAVLYCLYVTQVDPLEYDLLFERFLDPSRISAPDVDSDIPDDRRAEVIEYVKKRYGEDNLCQIVTFNQMKAKSAIRAVGRALDLNNEADAAAKKVPNTPNIKIDQALSESVDFKELYYSNEKVKKIVDIARELEGVPTHIGTHAAGTLIADKRGLLFHVPLCKTDKGIVSQYAMGNLDEMGMLKLDLLGLTQLKLIVNTLKLIEKNYDIKINPYDLYKPTDNKVYKIICDGNTEGIFQLESAGMTNFMRELQPDKITDLIAGIALYRPGPMDMIPQYIEGKRNPKSIHYDFPELESIFKETYGVMTYQEQCMRSAILVAGYQKHHSDSLRRGIAKKKKQLIDQHREWFIYGREETETQDAIPGGIKTGHDEAALQAFYNKMEKFGSYAFNKSHACCYAILGYATAWLKTYYPLEYMSVIMDESSKDQVKISEYIDHCKRAFGAEILPPSINHSATTFTPFNGQIMYSLSVKDTKSDTLDALIKEREEHGDFSSLKDFVVRCADFMEKSTLKSLANVGAFDEFGLHRSQMCAAVDDICNGYQKFKAAKARFLKTGPTRYTKEEPKVSSYISDNIIPDIAEFPDDIKLRVEKSTLGLYLSSNPLKKHMYSVTSYSNFFLKDLAYDIDPDTNEVIFNGDVDDKKSVQMVCILSGLNIFTTKKDKKVMAMAKITDLTGSAKALIFNRVFVSVRDVLVDDEVYKIKGTVSIRQGEEPVIFVNAITPLKDSLHKRVIFKSDDEMRCKEFTEYIEKMNIKGDCPVYISYHDMRVLLKKRYWVNCDLFKEYCGANFLNDCVVKEW